MSERKEYRLGDLLIIKYGKDHKKLGNGDIPVYGSGGIMRTGDAYLSDKPSVLIPRKGTLSNIFYVEEPFWTVDTMFWSEINDSIVLPKYLYYAIKDYKWDSMNVGSAVPSLTVPVIESVSVSIPSIETQLRIAAQLSEIDDKIAINRRICENLEAQAQALFKHWFIDFAPFKDGKFIDSELGMIPEGWSVGTLGELIDIKYGKDHKKLEDGTIPVYGSAGLMRKVNKYLYQGESVLIPRKGTLNNVMLVNEAFWTVDTMFYSVPKYKNILKYVFLKLSRINLAKLNVGTSIPSNSTDQLNKIVILIPSNKVLEHFETIMNDIFECKKNRELESLRLSTLRDTLLPKLMSGQIKV